MKRISGTKAVVVQLRPGRGQRKAAGTGARSRSPKTVREHEAHMLASAVYAEMSASNDTRVGALLVKDGNVLSIGCNGTPPGWNNATEHANGRTVEWLCHAEANAIDKLAAGGGGARGATLYCVYSPCEQCALQIIRARVAQVVYLIPFWKGRGLKWLKKSLIKTVQLDESVLKRVESIAGYQYRRGRECAPVILGACDCAAHRGAA
ncbi:MAG TPA: deaminase [Nevskiaceae bacterium]|nr:deaminase [Nevskiaceae bacterium]